LVLQPNFAAFPRLLTIYDAVAEIGCAKSVGISGVPLPLLFSKPAFEKI